MKDVRPNVLKPHRLMRTDAVDLPSVRQEINADLEQDAADHFVDLIIAAGVLADPGRFVINRDMGLAVYHSPPDGLGRAWYQVVEEVAGTGVLEWPIAFSIVYRDGRGPDILRHHSGDWEAALLAWAFAGAGARSLEVVDGPPRSDVKEPEPLTDEQVVARILHPDSCERIEAILAERYLSDSSVPAPIRIAAARLRLRVWFDASLAAHVGAGRRFTTHPDVGTFASMILAEPDARQEALGGSEVVDALSARFGRQDGMARDDCHWSGGPYRRDWAERHRTEPIPEPRDLLSPSDLDAGDGTPS